MDARAALDVAFSDGLKVRGRGAREAARVALAVHASRTVDPAPFLLRDPSLAADAIEALGDEGRRDLALQVALWAATGGAEHAVPRDGAFADAVGGFERARRWAEEGGEASPLWIRDVPREATLREAFAHRLALLGQAGGEGGGPLAAAALETLLSESPRPSTFSTILRAAALAASARVVERTLEGLSLIGPGPLAQGPRDPLQRLRDALEVERERAKGALIVDVLASRAARADASNAMLVAHLAARAHSEGHKAQSERALSAARRALEGGGRAPRAPLAALMFVEQGLGVSGAADPLGLPAESRPSAAELVEGACEACRALRSAKPAVVTMRLFDPEDATVAASEKDAAHLLKELVREGAQAAVEPCELESLQALLARVRRIGLRLPWEVFLRALIADGAAAVAARHPNTAAWALALDASGPGLSGFERAKMRGRAACEFLRALEVKAVPRPLADLYFAPALREAASGPGEG